VERGTDVVEIKTPLPVGPVRGEVTEYLVKDLSTARSSATGTGTAAAATAQGIGGSDGESRAVSRIHKIDFDRAAFFQKTFFH